MSKQREEYEMFIKKHSNYDFLPDEQKKNWLAVSKKGDSTPETQKQNPRLSYWVEERNRYIQLGKLSEKATLTNLARLIHPTKIHVCKICGNSCSIFYVYPTQNTIKWLNNYFPEYKYDPNCHDTIFDIYNKIVSPNKKSIFTSRFGKNIEELKTDCYNDAYEGKHLSPGVMGNPPDRLDGFHCYNKICCRKENDKGRSDDNMKSYSRDRRAYEMFSDGNVLLTNKLMGKLNTVSRNCIECGKYSAMTGDHIGPISLGFVHHVTNIQACCKACNSLKNNRLTSKDYNKLRLLEENNIPIVSWWAKECWDKNKTEPLFVIQEKMNKNAKKCITIIEWLKTNKKEIIKEYIEKDYPLDNHSYVIDTIDIDANGDIHFSYSVTLSNKKTKNTQQKRIAEILLENQKNNRKIKTVLTSGEIEILSAITYETFKYTICLVLQLEAETETETENI